MTCSPPRISHHLRRRPATLYRIAEDDDGRFALYVNACRDRADSPVHNHTTWAVVCGYRGEELNRFYRRRSDGTPSETHHEVVREGSGVAMLPDDLHSIHIAGGGMNFHMYGLALDRLDERVYFERVRADVKRMGAFGIIREAVSVQPPTCEHEHLQRRRLPRPLLSGGEIAAA